MEGATTPRTAAALAGRRIDAPGASPARFPLAMAASVEARLRALLAEESVTLLVSSAACGADLLAIKAATALGVRNRIVLPFERDEFKAKSVIDRPGDWALLFDASVDAAAARGDLVVLTARESDEASFAAANDRIIADTQSSKALRRIAIAVWEGGTRGDGDATADLIDAASQHGFETRTILTV